METEYRINPIEKRGKEINLKELFGVIKRRLWVIFVVTVIMTIAGYVYGKMTQTVVYQSSTRMIIKASADELSTLKVMVRDPIVTDEVIKELNLPLSHDILAQNLLLTDINGSQVVNLSVLDTDPNRAVSIANTTAKVFKDQMAEVLNFHNIQLLSEPRKAIPMASDPTAKIKLGFVAGIVIGIGLVFLLDSLDDSIRKNREVELFLDIPVLGTVSKMSKKNIRKKKSTELEIIIRGGETIGTK